jgi:2-polyprenyl-3-methyl-5-hydroxy-6-metoxy-1,4-benzoquinol methylase
LDAKDYTVSNEVFSIWKCQDCSLQFTQAVPDANHIGKYYQSESYVSHSDTQKGIINQLYHFVRNITLKRKRSLIEATTKKSTGSILDIGCGTGAFLHTMQQAGWDITGLEPDETASNNAKKLYDITTAPPSTLFSLPENKFDAITMWHVLEHVHQLNEYISQLKKILLPNGRIFIAVPNYTSFDAAHYQSHWAAYDVPRHLYHFSPKSMEKLLANHGLTILSHQPMWFDSFYVSLLSEKYKKTGLIGMMRAFFVGCISNLIAVRNIDRGSSIIYEIKKID